MKQSEIDEIVKSAKIETIDDETVLTHRVNLESLEASIEFTAKDEKDVRSQLPAAVKEILTRRGIEITEE